MTIDPELLSNAADVAEKFTNLINVYELENDPEVREKILHLIDTASADLGIMVDLVGEAVRGGVEG